MRLERTNNTGRTDGRMEADNQSKEVEIGGRRGNSRSIDDVRCEGGEEERGGKGEAPNITQQLIALKQIQAQKGRPTIRSVMFPIVSLKTVLPSLQLHIFM